MTSSIATFEELIAGGGKRRFRTVDLPVAGVTVRIRSMLERELSAYHARINSAKDDKQLQSRLMMANRQFISLCLVDADGNTIVPTDETGRLSDMDAADTSHLYKECARHCGINTQDIEDLVKNSDKTTLSEEPTD